MAPVHPHPVSNVEKGLESAPAQVFMNDSLGDGVIVMQATSECCRCCCCQPNIDWKISPYKEDWSAADADAQPVGMYIKENAPFVGRCFSAQYPGFRQTIFDVHRGDSPAGPVLFSHSKSWTCSTWPLLAYDRDGKPIRCPWCCCLPYLETHGPNGELLGRTKQIFRCFVPSYEVYDGRGEKHYRVEAESCCLGMCIRPRCGGQGGKCCRLAFTMRPAGRPQEPIKEAEITELWAGLKHECCTKREVFAVRFPPDMPTKDAENMKRTLIGTTLLIDMTVYEQEN